jgi:hypothetical protein
MDQPEMQELAIHSSAAPHPSHGIPRHEEPPNDTVTAWLKVLGGFFVFVNTWGIASSFGVYQAFYEANTLASYSPSAISWIGTVQVFFLEFIRIFAGPLYN